LVVFEDFRLGGAGLGRFRFRLGAIVAARGKRQRDEQNGGQAQGARHIHLCFL